MDILFLYLLSGLLFGFVTKQITNNKGYQGGFWIGFFLQFLGVLIVLTKRDNPQVFILQENEKMQLIKQYRELFEAGTITQQEFEDKKEVLLYS